MYSGKQIVWTAAIALAVVLAYNHLAARGGPAVSLRRAA